ncbi:transmembrane protein 150A-like isoform X2 [Malaclemys terrapin pileata]|uniref:transmembrane protein 150A-like isoform X2 n=1 Tax=Malaclemys terrapin pileata TaxID=2991368 RepID=UPI0023A853AD|nr:transmembrane protein 150A-like isoform X2 [Malaclemys terrapin pileata]
MLLVSFCVGIPLSQLRSGPSSELCQPGCRRRQMALYGVMLGTFSLQPAGLGNLFQQRLKICRSWWAQQVWCPTSIDPLSNVPCSLLPRSYNQSCGLDGPISCCTLDHIPLVSKCGTFPPESCFFSLICSLGSFMVMLVGLLRYAHVIECCGPSLLNTLGLAAGWICAAGLTMVGNFQSVLTYRMAKTRGRYWTGHLRSILSALAFITLVFSGVFFVQESFVLQHVAALCEWIFIINILVFYGTFTFEFGAISTDTFLVLLKASRAPKSYKSDSSTASTPHGHSHSEGLAMV